MLKIGGGMHSPSSSFISLETSFQPVPTSVQGSRGTVLNYFKNKSVMNMAPESQYLLTDFCFKKVKVHCSIIIFLSHFVEIFIITL